MRPSATDAPSSKPDAATRVAADRPRPLEFDVRGFPIRQPITSFVHAGCPPARGGAGDVTPASGIHALPGPLSRSFVSGVNAPSAARGALKDLKGHIEEGLLERARIVVTELVTKQRQARALVS